MIEDQKFNNNKKINYDTATDESLNKVNSNLVSYLDDTGETVASEQVQHLINKTNVSTEDKPNIYSEKLLKVNSGILDVLKDIKEQMIDEQDTSIKQIPRYGTNNLLFGSRSGESSGTIDRDSYESGGSGGLGLGVDDLFDLGRRDKDKEARKGKKKAKKAAKAKKAKKAKASKTLKGKFPKGGKLAKAGSVVKRTSGGVKKLTQRALKPAASVLRKTAGKALAKGALKFIPGIGLIATAGFAAADAYQGWNNAGEILGKDGELSFGDKASAATGSLISGLTFGLVDESNTAKGISNLTGGNETIEKYEDLGIIDHDVIGDSDIEDWQKLSELPATEIQKIIDIDDWDDEDKSRMEDLQKQAKIRDDRAAELLRISKEAVKEKEEKEKAAKAESRITNIQDNIAANENAIKELKAVYKQMKDTGNEAGAASMQKAIDKQQADLDGMIAELNEKSSSKQTEPTEGAESTENVSEADLVQKVIAENAIATKDLEEKYNEAMKNGSESDIQDLNKKYIDSIIKQELNKASLNYVDSEDKLKNEIIQARLELDEFKKNNPGEYTGELLNEFAELQGNVDRLSSIETRLNEIKNPVKESANPKTTSASKILDYKKQRFEEARDKYGEDNKITKAAFDSYQKELNNSKDIAEISETEKPINTLMDVADRPEPESQKDLLEERKQVDKVSETFGEKVIDGLEEAFDWTLPGIVLKGRKKAVELFSSVSSAVSENYENTGNIVSAITAGAKSVYKDDDEVTSAISSTTQTGVSSGSQGEQGNQGNQSQVDRYDDVPGVTGPIVDYIKQNEGLRLQPYKDTLGYWTIGYGHLIRPDEQHLMKGISKEQADKIFAHDFEEHKKAASGIPGFSEHPKSVQDVLVDMTFNMGPAWYKKWPNTMRKLKEKDYAGAADAIMNSRYASQVGRRARNNVAIIRQAASMDNTVDSTKMVSNATVNTGNTSETSSSKQPNQQSVSGTTSTVETEPNKTPKETVAMNQSDALAMSQKMYDVSVGSAMAATAASNNINNTVTNVNTVASDNKPARLINMFS